MQLFLSLKRKKHRYSRAKSSILDRSADAKVTIFKSRIFVLDNYEQALKNSLESKNDKNASLVALFCLLLLFVYTRSFKPFLS